MRILIAEDETIIRMDLRALLEAGSDSDCLWLFPLDRSEEILELTAREVLPRL